MYDKHQIFLTFTAMMNIIVLISNGIFCFKNLKSIDAKVVYTSLGMFLISTAIFFALIFTIMHDRNPIYMKILIVFYVLLIINLILFLVFSFYKKNIFEELDETSKATFGVIIATVLISTILFLVSEFLITNRERKIENDESIELERVNPRGKIIELNSYYSEEKIKENNDIIFIRERTLKDFINIPNVISIPTKINPCNISITEDCYLKDSDLFTPSGKFSVRRFRAQDCAARYRNKTLKEIYDDVFRKILEDAAEGNQVAFPKGELGDGEAKLRERAPKIFKYINGYRKYLLLLSKIYGDKLPSHLKGHQILTPETLYSLNPDLEEIERKNNHQIEKSLASMIAKKKRLDICQYILSHLKDKRRDRGYKEDRNLVDRMRTLVVKLDCHDENIEKLSQVLASNFRTVQEARIMINELSEEFLQLK